jgi:hypothetical protein
MTPGDGVRVTFLTPRDGVRVTFLPHGNGGVVSNFENICRYTIY